MTGFSIEQAETYGGKQRWRASYPDGRKGPWRKSENSAQADGRRSQGAWSK